MIGQIHPTSWQYCLLLCDSGYPVSWCRSPLRLEPATIIIIIIKIGPSRTSRQTSPWLSLIFLYQIILQLVHSGVFDKGSNLMVTIHGHYNCYLLIIFAHIQCVSWMQWRLCLLQFDICFNVAPSFRYNVCHSLLQSYINSDFIIMMYMFVPDRGMLLFIGHGHVTSQEVQCSLRGTSVVNKAVLNDVTLQSLTEVNNIFLWWWYQRLWCYRTLSV